MGNKTKFIFIGSGMYIGIVVGLVIAARLDLSPKLGAVDIPQQEAFKVSLEEGVENVAGVIGKAVVSISSERSEKLASSGVRRYYFGGPPQDGPFEDDFFRRFFEDFFGEMPQREYRQSGLGSGVIIDKEGYILTNEHVIGEADKITVTLPDGRELKAEVKGTDRRSDLAVIKISGSNFPVAALGDSDNLKIGQWVVAIGNPFGFALSNPEPTVTAGVVSALHRSLGRIASGDRDYGDLIQTDAAINPGNSGGPLVNLKGEVVGINVAIFSTSGGYQGIGFAVPVNSAKRIVSKLIEGKKIVYGWLGVTVQNLDEKLAEYFNLEEKKGVLVSKILAGSPAKKAGIKEGDIIIRFNNEEINNVNTLIKLVGNIEAGKKVKVGLFRDKKSIDLEVEIGPRPENIEDLSGLKAMDDLSNYWRGIRVMEITPELAKKFRLSEDEGVAVVDVRPDSLADEAGLAEGDIILEINKVPIGGIAAYKRVINETKGDCLIRTSRGFFVIKGEPG